MSATRNISATVFLREYSDLKIVSLTVLTFWNALIKNSESKIKKKLTNLDQ